MNAEQERRLLAARRDAARWKATGVSVTVIGIRWGKGWHYYCVPRGGAVYRAHRGVR